MSAWNEYQNRMDVRGGSKRNAISRREVHNIYSHLPDNMSYTDVTIDDIEQTVAIINSDNLDEKIILSLPGEDIKHGGLVHWMDNYWLVIEKDANRTLYTRAKLHQCNYLLKWVSEDLIIHEQWCYVEDGTKLRKLVSVWRNPYDKRPIELLETPKSFIGYNVIMRMDMRECLKTIKIGQSAAKPYMRGTFNDQSLSRRTASDWLFEVVGIQNG